jgi:MFS family permease
MDTPWSPGPASFLILGVLGFSGAGFVLTFATAKERVHPELSGMAVSVVNTGCFIGTALMQPLFGYLADRNWTGTFENGIRIYAATDYHHGFLSMLVFAIFALVAGFKIKKTNCRNICA